MSNQRLETVLSKLERLLDAQPTYDPGEFRELIRSRPRSTSAPLLLEHAKFLYRQRRQREQIFDDSALFGEPAWDILLDLFIAEHDDRLPSVTSVSIASCKPVATALRWIKVLEKKKLVSRIDDLQDARRSFLRLTSSGEKLMETVLVTSLSEVNGTSKCSSSYLIQQVSK